MTHESPTPLVHFRSAAVRAGHSKRAVLEALDNAGPESRTDAKLVLVNAAVGHDLVTLSRAIQEECPSARVLAASCAGVVGREGPGESMYDMAVMVLSGSGFSVASVDQLFGDSSFDKGAELAQRLVATAPLPIRMLYLLASGIDIANDRLIAGIESVLGPEIVIFGATSSDQMQGVATFQAVDGERYRHGAFAVGFWDPTLSVETQATHGFEAVGEPMTISTVDGNRITAIDDAPAWPTFLMHLELPSTATEADTIPIGALAEELPPALAAEYGNSHILRVVTHHTAEGHLVYATQPSPGLRLWLTRRNEERIFREMDRMTTAMTARQPNQWPIAVFQADCLARGRRLFNRVMKEELVHRIQQPFAEQGQVPPWFGMYGFGEYARLGGRNAYHNYTTALAAIYRTPRHA